MVNRFEKLRLVILESPYDSWSDERAESLFARMVGLKIRGYGREYPYGTLAVDGTDLIADHLLICEETEAGLKPLFGSKSIPLSKCLSHQLRFPGLSVLEDSGALPQAEAVRGLMERALRGEVDLRYIGSLTMDPAERGDREWSRRLRDLFTTMYVQFHSLLPSCETLAGGTIRFKIDEYVKWLGHKPLLDSAGRELAPVRVRHLASEPVLWTHLTEFSWDARRVAKEHERFWSDRIHVKAVPAHVEKLKKPA